MGPILNDSQVKCCISWANIGWKSESNIAEKLGQIKEMLDETQKILD